MTNKLEIHIIELPKIRKEGNTEDVLLDWLYFLENPKSERVEKRMKENKALREAQKKLVILSENEKMQRIAELREKAVRDEKAIYDKGIDDGIKQGKKHARLEIAKQMLKENIDIDIILRITGLTKEEIL